MITFKYNQYTPEGTVVHTKTVGEGSTLYWRSESVQVMSDIWEWLPVAYYEENGRLAQRIVNFETDTVVVDATPETFQRLFKTEYDRYFTRFTGDADHQANRVDVKGRMVKVTRGRTDKGKVGKVVAIIERPYSMGYRSSYEYKLGIAIDDQKMEVKAPNGKTYQNYVNLIWVWARNCEVVNPTPDYTDIVERATDAANVLVNNLKERFAEALTAQAFQVNPRTVEVV